MKSLASIKSCGRLKMIKNLKWQLLAGWLVSEGGTAREIPDLSLARSGSLQPKMSDFDSFSTDHNSGPRPPILGFHTTFGIVRPSPSILEHPQPLSRLNERAIRGGGNGLYPRVISAENDLRDHWRPRNDFWSLGCVPVTLPTDVSDPSGVIYDRREVG